MTGVQTCALPILKQGADFLAFGIVEGFSKGIENFSKPELLNQYQFKIKIVDLETGETAGYLEQKYETKRALAEYSMENAGKIGFFDIEKDENIQPLVVDTVKHWLNSNPNNPYNVIFVSNVDMNLKKLLIDSFYKMHEITWVNFENYKKNCLEFRVKSKIESQKLAEKLESELPFEVTKLNKGLIEANWKN